MKKLTKVQFKLLIMFGAVVFVAVDQLIKYIVVKNMNLHDTIPILKDVLHITYVLNDGAAFSMLSGQSWLLCGVTSVFMIGLIVAFFTKHVNDMPTLCSLGLIISGGVGNLIDRVFRGEELFNGLVVDYIDFRLINFAIFNFADCCVVIGGISLILICVCSIYLDYKKSKAQKEEPANE